MNNKLTIVIPAYNEEFRIGSTLFELGKFMGLLSNHCLDLNQVIIVDDGSKDNTFQEALKFQSQLPICILKHSCNMGKGAAVRTGLKDASGDLILIADADMATPWTEFTKLYKEIQNGADVSIASRGLPDSIIKTRQPFYREYLGKSFNFILRLITGLKFKDTQCGFKLIKSKPAKFALKYMQINRFAWDVEFLLITKLHGYEIKEVGVNWNHVEQSRVHPIMDSLEMLWRVLKLRIRFRALPTFLCL